MAADGPGAGSFGGCSVKSELWPGFTCPTGGLNSAP